MIFKKAIPRRTFLRGVGATLALPLLDGMVPAFAAAADTGKAPVRMSFVYVPCGIMMEEWTPETEGAGFEFTPTLKGLAPFRDHLVVLSGLTHNEGRIGPGESAGDHPRAGATYLTGVHPAMGKEARVGISVDQVAAAELGKQTQLASLELAMEATVVGACESGWSCAYQNTLCWRSATTPLPTEHHPRVIFERLFGDSDSTDPAARLARLQADRSVLDLVTQPLGRLLKDIGPGDRVRLTEYLDAIRDAERRIQLAEKQASREVPSFDRPTGVPPTYEEHAKLMFDLQTLAYQTDLTRVITFMLGFEQSTLAYREIGVTDPHHPLTHHQLDRDKIAKVIKINLFHIKLFAYFLEKLRSTPDGDGSLLDHSMIVYGSSLSDGNIHAHNNLPILLLGGGYQIKGGRHIRFPNETPLMNLFLTMLDKLGIPVEKLGDSTGKLELPSV